MKYLIYIMNCLLLILIPAVVYQTPIDNQKQTVEIDYSIKKVKSKVITTEKKIEQKDSEEVKSEENEELKEDNKIINNNEIKEEKKVEQQKPEEQPIPPKNETPIEPPVEEKENDVIETQVGKMSGYGPNCVGCSGYLASGKYVGNGTIYYNDKKYGNVRIVAGDYKYKLGSIVRIKNSKVSSEPILAIVLDRGGTIGLNKTFMFDLLFESEEVASKYEVSYNVTFEILRNGY